MKKILIAEDDKFLALAYRAKLAKAGFDISIASDGEEVITMLRNITPNVILLDLIMPKKDGFWTLEEIKANTSWKNIPVIIASNLGQHEDIERGMKLGASDYIIKSETSLDKLVEKIDSLLKKDTSPTS